jgi:hypothetical protein
MDSVEARPRTLAQRIAVGVCGVCVVLVLGQAALLWIRGRGVLGIRMEEKLDRFVVFDPFRSCHGRGGETSTISSLSFIHSAQQQFRDAACLDEDRDGRGEYGSLVELAGAAPVRGTDRAVQPLLSGAFRQLDAGGEAGRSGYRIRVFLPAREGGALGGGPAGIPAGASDPDRCEATWCAYAWPAKFDWSGLETFCVTADGSIWRTEDARYDGPGAGPAPGAAFVAGGLQAIGSDSASSDRSRTEHVGQDGNVWRLIR